MNSRSALRALGKRLKPYTLSLVMSIVLSVVYVVFSLYVPKMVGKATDIMLGAGHVNMERVVEIAITIAVMTVVAALAWWVMGLFNNHITYSLIRDIRQETFAKIQVLPLKRLDKHSKGEMVSRIITDVDQLADGLLMGFSQFFTGVFTIMLTLVFMLMINVKVALVVILLTPLSIFIARFVASHTYDMFKKQSETRAEQTAIIDETIGGAKIVKSFSRENHMLEQFDETNERLEKCYQKATFYSSLTNPSTRFVNNLIYAGVAVCGGLVAVSTGGITVGALAAILTYANQYMKPFNEISGVITELQNALACASRVFELIDNEQEIDESGKTELTNVQGDVDVSGLVFGYTKEKILLKDINIHVDKGQTVAIIGETGGGKTTFINLLMRFYEINGGTIKIDGKNIQDVTRKSLRQNFGMVLQDTWVRNATIRDNIKFSKPDASDDEMIEAAKACHAHNFIMRLPKGYDTVIKEGGENLSAGQKQLICITRVMLNLPPMLILDEATSSIDTRTEMRIQRAFEKMMNGRTTFIVAHRLSTIENADLIMEMRGGTLVQQK